ncbi:MAG: hypothetical protein NVS2B7_23150 [Herpetosiphon sp.]
MHTSDLQRLELQCNALFTHDANGRIRWINEAGERPAPRFFFGRTKEGNLWRLRHDVPLDIVRRVETLAATEPVTQDLRAEPIHLVAYRAALQEHAEIVEQGGGPAYYFPDEIDEIQVSGSTVVITEMNIDLLRPLIPQREMEDISRVLSVGQPWVVMVHEGSSATCCYSARKTERVAEAGVWTLEAFRGRGFAPASVAAWARRVRGIGRIPLYSTSWENIASQRVARKLGLIQYATDLSVT